MTEGRKITFWLSIVLGLIVLQPVMAQESSGVEAYVFSMDSLSVRDGTMQLRVPWRYQSGDDPAYAGAAFDDSDWVQASPHQSDSTWTDDWPGIGWFRLPIRTDSTVKEEVVGLQLIQFGAAEVYLNGNFLYQVGEVGSSAGEVRTAIQHMPHYFTLQPEQDYVLAVRLAKDLDRLRGVPTVSGFTPMLSRPDRHLPALRQQIETTTGLFLGVIGLFIAFALLHFCLFVAYPAARENGYFAGATASLAIAVSLAFYMGAIASPDEWPVLVAANSSFTLLVCLFTIGLAHTLFHGRIGRVFWGFIVLAVLTLGIMIVFEWYAAVAIFVAVASIELVRVSIMAAYHSRSGGWVVGSGLAAVALGFGVMMLMGLEIIPVFHEYAGFAPVVGVMVLAGTMSVFLAQRIANTNRDLERQLHEVEVQTEERLAQERRARKEEVRRSLLEERYRQKVEELEQVRALQLSMLPEKVPRIEGLEIAAGMKTATEVGGDYYDFKKESGGWVFAIGDATGHGMSAGAVVTATKSLFSTLGENENLVAVVRRFSKCLKDLEMPSLYMALMLMRWDGNQLRVVSAGIPPLLIYRAVSGSVQTVRSPGMPLGSFLDYPYKENCITLQEGDTVLAMTDGVAECFNKEGKMLGYERVPDYFQSVAGESTEAVVDGMIQAGLDWAGAEDPDDDMTFLVIRPTV